MVQFIAYYSIDVRITHMHTIIFKKSACANALNLRVDYGL